MSELRSKCHGTEVKKDIRYIQHVDDGIVEYICSKCHKPCKVEEKEERGESE